MRRWQSIDSHIRTQLNPYMGARQITLIGEALWKSYPIARKRTGKGKRKGDGSEIVSDATIRAEMTTIRAIMAYAVEKKLIPNLSPFKAVPGLKKVSREEFTPREYRKLHTYARTKWKEKARSSYVGWYRKMVYWFILVMTNTGMRPPEARNLRWRDVEIRSDSQGRPFVAMNVRGKGKFRTLVAPIQVAEYLDEIKAISPAKGPDDPVFCTRKGEVAVSLYNSPLGHLLLHSKLLFSASGSRRSTYCFRHTYATFRLTEGVDSLFLAKQMGTSVKMIEDHYGHVSPDKNAERILQGLPGWGAASDAAVATFAEVNDASPPQDGASAKPKRKKGREKSRSSSTAAAIFRRDHRAPRPARGEFAKAGNAEAEKSINAVADQFRVTSRSLRARGLNTEDPPGRASNRRHRRDTSRQFVRTRTVWSPQPIQIEQTVLNCACTNPDCIIGSFRHSEGSWNKKQPVGEVESSGSSSSAAPCQRRGSRSRICRQCSSPPHERRSLPSWRRSS
jgi:integrase